ncbi:hypothetical protein [Enterococcus nangangensis]|uniref:hypothetical protein n=1 Tax=Enterococcus nangangensis TaxID=2559926 RepID=UPI0010F8B8D5|nr:hypothetical protein [Enterococcus nangangensis]
MQVIKDTLGRVQIVDDFQPAGKIIFDPYKDRISVYQDSADTDLSIKFEALEESAEFSRAEIIEALEWVIKLLKEDSE